MFWSFVAPKGGVGVSVVAASVAATLSSSMPVTIVDFCGDQAEIFGIEGPPPGSPGVHDWLSADATVSPDALSNLELEVHSDLRIIPPGVPGSPEVSAQRCAELVDALSRRGVVVADVGILGTDPVAVRPLVCAAGDETTMVLRACYLALRRARRCPVTVDHVVEVVEGGRSLRTIDIEAVLGQAVSSRLVVDPMIARAVDAGLLATRVPRTMRRVVAELCQDARVPAGVR